ncbi:unnamed protein product [Absidia cylindrospora]
MLSESKPSFSEKIILTDDHSYKTTKDNINGSSIHGINHDILVDDIHKTFQIALVDIKKTATEEEIYCIKKPLEGEGDFKFIAVSYRWGELEETTVDTQVDYLATVTSFDMRDFYKLCKWMTMEDDLKHINYAWVDAICVDRTNHRRRKETIYQMSNIYERATYIVSVPDLHLSYLMDTNTKANQIICDTIDNSQYIYHLIHENTDELVKIDEQWLDSIRVPKNQGKRQMLAKYDVHFDDGLQQKYNSKHYPDEAYNQDYSLGTGTSPYSHRNISYMIDFTKSSCGKESTPKGKDEYVSWNDHVEEIQNNEWKRLIALRTQSIQQSMDFLTDLIKDWSQRVWVINEYNIAKRKNKLKYWFIQLEGPQVSSRNESFCFFRFDFDDLFLSFNGGGAEKSNCIFNLGSSYHALTTYSEYMYQKFIRTMRRQLNRQTFLEMMLKSKASRNEDRFHAILPLSEYMDKFGLLMSGSKITDIISVKLKLYEMMNTRHKLELLFLSNNPSSKVMVLPTFASSQIQWPTIKESTMLENDPCPCNFDLENENTIMLMDGHLHSHDDDDDDDDDDDADYHYRPRQDYKLNIKPCEYYTCDDSGFAEAILEKNKAICAVLGMGDPEERFEMVCVPSYGDSDIHASSILPSGNAKSRKLYLIGSFSKNKWLVTTALRISSTDNVPTWTAHYSNDDDVGFDIY